MTGTDWREHAKRGDWGKISWILLPDADRVELYEMLRRIVPRRERGDGVERYEGFITPNEASSKAEYEAVFLAERLERWLQNRAREDAYDSPLDEAIEYAIAELQEHGIKYEGYRETFLYWSASRGRWRQIPGSMAAAMKAKQWKIRERIPDDPKTEHDAAMHRYLTWEAVYPWRMCKSLHTLWRIDAFEPNSPIWHALQIFDWHEQFKDALFLVRSDDSDHSSEELLMDAVESALEIGRSYEALIKKPFEPHAIFGMKTSEGVERGAAATAAITGESTQPRLEEMKRLVPKLGVAGAASHLAAKGMGSISANKGLWYRQQQK